MKGHRQTHDHDRARARTWDMRRGTEALWDSDYLDMMLRLCLFLFRLYIYLTTYIDLYQYTSLLTQ
jgi:hypothetical protein